MNAQASILDSNEGHQNHSRDEHIHSEEGADAVDEQLSDEERKIHPVCENPWHELPVWEQRPDKAEYEVNSFRLHPGNLAEGWMRMSNPRRDSVLQAACLRTIGIPDRLDQAGNRELGSFNVYSQAKFA